MTFLKDNVKGKQCGYIIIYIVLTLILLIRAKYGFCWTDEAYYVSGVNRLLSGDRIITDEWYISQLFSIILYPFVLVFKLLKGDFDGIYYSLRIMYVIMQTAIAVSFYKVMTKQGIENIPSFLASLVIMLYSKQYICTLSYYSVIFAAFVLLLLLLYSYKENEIIKSILIGICSFIVLLINPYFVGIFFLALLTLLVLNIRKNKLYNNVLIKVNFLFIFSGVGILICAVLAGIMVLRNNSISELLQCIPIILEDSDYTHSIWWKMLHAFLYIIEQFKYTIGFVCIFFGCSIYLLCKGKLTEARGNIIFLFSVLFFSINCLDDSNWNGGIQTAFAFLGLESFILNENRNWKIFIHFYIPGIIMAVMMNLSSDTRFDAMTLGFVISGAVSCIFVYDYLKKYRNNKLIYIAGVIGFCAVVAMPAFFRVYAVYRDSSLLNLKAEITKGPAKGLYTTCEHKEQYEEVLEVIQTYCDQEGMVFVSSWCPWAYLCTDMKCGAYSTWRLNMEKSEEKLKKYYELYPERIPDVVIELSDEIGKIDRIEKFPDVDWLYTSPQADQKRRNSFLWKYMEENNYLKIPVKCGVVYISWEIENNR